MKNCHLAAATLLLCTGAAQLVKADAFTIVEKNAAGVVVENTPFAPSVCGGNPFPQNGLCTSPASDFNYTTVDGDYTISGDDTIANVGGLFQLMNITITVIDNKGVNGSVFFDMNQIYAFSGIATSYTAFDFMNGNFATAAANAGTNVLATLVVDGVTLPALGANAAQPDAGGFNRGPGFAVFGTPPVQGVNFDAQALFTFQAGAAQAAGDAISLPFGESDAPEPASMILFGSGLLGIAGYRSRRKA